MRLYICYLTGITCGATSNPTNGAVSVTNSGSYPSTATYTCNDGYALSDAAKASITCTAGPGTAAWATTAPTCVGRLNPLTEGFVFYRIAILRTYLHELFISFLCICVKRLYMQLWHALQPRILQTVPCQQPIAAIIRQPPRIHATMGTS